MKTAEEIFRQKFSESCEKYPDENWYSFDEMIIDPTNAFFIEAMEEYAAQFKPQWISVEERLPDNDKNVLAILDGEVCIMAYVSFKEGSDRYFQWGYVYDGINGDPMCDDLYEPTHWMPLPEKP